MPDSEPPNQHKPANHQPEAIPRPPTGLEARTGLLITFGLAAMITSVFGLGGDLVKGRQSTYEQRCSIAQQVVLDESPSPALNATQHGRLNVVALRRVEQCIGETK